MRAGYQYVLTAWAALALAGCGGTPVPEAVTVTMTSQAATPSPQASPVAAHTSSTSSPPAVSTPPPPPASAPTFSSAAAVVAALTKAVPTAKASVTYTEQNDPNHLLGRPGGYTSKTSFTDARLRPADVQDPSRGAVDLGGSVEVYPSAAGALRRGTYIQATIQAMGVLAHEYDFVCGPVVLRLAANFTPEQTRAVAALTGQDAVESTP